MSAETVAAWAGVALAAASLVVAILATARANRAVAVTERDEARRLERSHVEWTQDLSEGYAYVLTNTGADAAFDVQVRVRVKTQMGCVQLLGTSERVETSGTLTIPFAMPEEQRTMIATTEGHVKTPVTSWKVESRISWRTQLRQPRDADLPIESLPKAERKSLRPIMG